ncbi:hypothetical protein D3C87_1489430 [compost metagenome]
MGLVPNQLQQRHRQENRVQHPFVDRELAGSGLHRRPVHGHQPRQDQGPRDIDHGMEARHHHDDVARTERLHRLATQHLARRHGADQRDRQGADVVPHGVQVLRAPADPHQRVHQQYPHRRRAVLPPAQRGDTAEDQQVAGEDDEIADRGANRPGHAAPDQHQRAADGERREADRENPQRPAAAGIGPMLPERHAGTGQKRPDGEEIKGEEVDVHPECKDIAPTHRAGSQILRGKAGCGRWLMRGRCVADAWPMRG